MTEIQEKIRDLLQPILASGQAFLIEALVRNDRNGKLVQVFVDTDKGITIQECAQISRELGKELDRLGILQTSYRLEVSSPGTERPLILLRQYPKNVGRRFKVTYREGEATKQVVGTLVSVDETRLQFKPEDAESVTTDFSTIIESKVVLPW